LFLADNDKEEQQKAGGAGLALLAFVQHARVRSGPEPPARLEAMRSLARFLVAHQYPDGHFRSNRDVERETHQRRRKEPPYYQGEAALGLIRLYTVLNDPHYLAAAQKAVAWAIDVRDAASSVEEHEQDHWMAYALDDLYRIKPEEAYRDEAIRIVNAIRHSQWSVAGAPQPDMAGTFGDARTTPASTRLEAYGAAANLFRVAGRPDASMLDAARDVALGTLSRQFDADNDYWLPNPDRAEGGVRESSSSNSIRVDYVQHAICAWLQLARELEAESE
jgi:hypothetical protein